MLQVHGPGPPFVGKISLFLCVAFCSCLVTCDRNKHYVLSELCQQQRFMQGIHRQIEGAILSAKNETDMECSVTFRTLSVLQRFMIRFDYLNLDCNDKLYIYDVASVVGTSRAELSCRNTSDTFGVMFTGTNHVTLKYVTDSWGTNDHGFQMLITAFKDETVQICSGFRCAYKNVCISNDLTCDGLNHCLDGSDEMLPQCNNKRGFMIFGMSTTMMVISSVISGLLLALMVGSIVSCFLCRKSPNLDSQRRRQFPAEVATTNGNSIHRNCNLKMTPHHLSVSGNLHHPVGLPLGYSEVRLRL